MDRIFWIVTTMILITFSMGCISPSEITEPKVVEPEVNRNIGAPVDLTPDQTEYKTKLEEVLEASNKDLIECIPTLVNEKGWYEFDTDETGCPSGIFKVNTSELLLKFFAMENWIREHDQNIADLDARIDKLEEIK